MLDDDYSYWSVSGEFQIRRATAILTDAQAWYTAVQARGFYYIKSNKRTAAVDDNGQPVLNPVAHNATTGALLAKGDAIQYYKFQVFPSADLNSIGLI